MYPPRKNQSSSSKSKGNGQSGYTSPPHKDLNKVNKILQNAKKYEQAKQQKRDYMMQGIMNLKKKQSDQQGSSVKVRTSSKQSQTSNKSRGEDQNRRDIYRKVETIDRNRNDSEQNRLSFHNMQQQIGSRQVRRQSNTNLNVNSNFRNSDIGQSEQIYRSQQQAMVRQSDRNFNQTGNRNYTYSNNAPQQIHSQNLVQSNFNSQVNTNLNINTNTNYKNTQASTTTTNQRYTNVQIPQQQNNMGSYSSKYESNIGSPRNVQQTSPPTFSQPSYVPQIQTNSIENNTINRNNVNANVNVNSNVNINTNSNSNTQRTYSNKPQIQRSPPNHPQPHQPPQITKIVNTNFNPVPNPPSPPPQSQPQMISISPNEYEQIKRITMQNNKRVQSRAESQQNAYLRAQLEELVRECDDIKGKFFRSEEEKSGLNQRIRGLDMQKGGLRKENQQLRMRIKNCQFEIENLKNQKMINQNQLRDLRGNRQMITDEMSRKMNQLNVQLRKKALELTQFQRNVSDLQAQLSQRNTQIRRLNDILTKKDKQLVKIKQLQIQVNQYNTSRGKSQFQLKSLSERVSTLETQNRNLREQKPIIQRLQSQISKSRKQNQQMLEDMKNLQAQLDQKQKVINHYKNISYKQSQNIKFKTIQDQINLVLQQKAEMAKMYEQKLLQKDKRIAQLQIQQNQSSKLSSAKLGGIEAGDASFEAILKQQLDQINLLKKQNTIKINQLFTTKIQLQNTKSQLQNETNKNRFLTLQSQSNQKSSMSITESHLKAAKHEIELLNRRIDTLNSTIEAKRKQNQNKDQFIKNYIIGVTQQGDPGALLANLQRILSRKL